jgi:hypothetical protein
MKGKDHMKARRNNAVICAALVMSLTAFSLTGCDNEAARVSENIRVDADNFNIRRRVTVINCRSDAVILQMEGCMSITDSSNRLDIIVELPDGSYEKHIIKLNDWTTWVVEQIESAEEDKYTYKLNFLPKMIPGVEITSDD